MSELIRQAWGSTPSATGQEQSSVDGTFHPVGAHSISSVNLTR